MAECSVQERPWGEGSLRDAGPQLDILGESRDSKAKGE